MTADRLRGLIDRASGAMAKLILIVALVAIHGLRRNELPGPFLDDLDMRHGTLLVSRRESARHAADRLDAGILIGVLAILEGAIWAGDLDEQTTSRIAERFAVSGDARSPPLANRSAAHGIRQRLRLCGTHSVPAWLAR